MKLRWALGAAIALTILLTPISGRCQSDDLIGALSGTSVPSVKTLGDIASAPGHWYRFEIAGSGGSGSYMQVIGAMFGGSESSEFFTTGQQATLGDAKFLVAYSVKQAPIDWSAMSRSGTPPAPQALTADSPLTLDLLNLSAMPGMVDIQPFDLQAVVAASSKQSNLITDMMGERTKVTNSAPSLSRAKQVMLGVMQYAEHHDEVFPPMTSASALKTAVFSYVKAAAIFTDPVSGLPFRPNPWLSRRKLATISAPESIVAIYSAQHSDGNRVVGYADGHVKELDSSQWASAKTDSHIP